MDEKSTGRGLGRRTFLKMAATGIAGAAIGASPAQGDEAVKPDITAPRAATTFAYGYDKEPYPLESGPHLFIDWRYIFAGRINWQTADGQGTPLFSYEEIKNVQGVPNRTPYGIRLVAQQAEKIGPIVPNDRDWEFMIGGYCSMHDLGGKFGVWYEVVPPKTDGNKNLICYAESKDGVTWTKPELGLVEFNGSKANNIVIDGAKCPFGTFHGNCVFIDPMAPPEERFKIIYVSVGEHAERIAKLKAESPGSVDSFGELKNAIMLLGSSPDGLRWKFSEKILFCHLCDTQTTVYYDPYLQRYVAFTRTLGMNRRAIGRCETADLTRWPVPETILYPQPSDDPCDDYYTNSKSIYPGTKTMHMMFPTVYKRRVDGCALRMAVSLDGVQWAWMPGDNVMECGPEGSWDGGSFFAGFGLTEISGNRVALPYGGYKYPHKYPRFGRMGQLGLAVWQKERLVALEADEDGEFYTQPMTLPGETLHLNFQTKRAGYIKVEVCDIAGHTLDDCDPLIGDQIKQQVTWKGQPAIGVAKGGGVMLRFKLRSAKLFSFEVK